MQRCRIVEVVILQHLIIFGSPNLDGRTKTKRLVPQNCRDWPDDHPNTYRALLPRWTSVSLLSARTPCGSQLCRSMATECREGDDATLLSSDLMTKIDSRRLWLNGFGFSFDMLDRRTGNTFP
jgi:hypothetical protein